MSTLALMALAIGDAPDPSRSAAGAYETGPSRVFLGPVGSGAGRRVGRHGRPVWAVVTS
jgi:hypothetical protein